MFFCLLKVKFFKIKYILVLFVSQTDSNTELTNYKSVALQDEPRHFGKLNEIKR